MILGCCRSWDGLFRRDKGLGEPSHSLSAVSKEIHQTIRDEAATQLASGSASESVMSPEKALVLMLEPRNPLAAPLEVCLDTVQLVNCSPGRNGMSIEMFSDDRADLNKQVREMTRAVLRGEYTEWVKENSEKPRIAAEWNSTDGRERAILNGLRFPRRGAYGWRLVTYEPY